MTTPSGLLNRILGGSTHSGSSLCSEYTPLGAVSMGCHCGCASSHALSVYSSISSTLYAASRYSLLWSSHFLNSVIFHLLYIIRYSSVPFQCLLLGISSKLFIFIVLCGCIQCCISRMLRDRTLISPTSGIA